MKKYFMWLTLCCTALLLVSFKSGTPTARELAEQMLVAGKQVQTLKFTLQKQERIKGKLMPARSDVKLQVKPFKAYFKSEIPNAGMEVLYVAGQNGNDAYIRPSSFPWTTLSLDPMGSTMRAGQHHTIFEMGFNHVLNTTDFLMKKYGNQSANMLKLIGTTTWDGLNCYQLTFDIPNFKYLDYTVQKNETLLTIANRMKISEYMILEQNPDISDYNDVKAGQKIKIPSDYARRISILLDQKTNLPVMVSVYDDKGLFEQYEYHNLQVNPPLKDAEFTKDYKGYKF